MPLYKDERRKTKTPGYLKTIMYYQYYVTLKVFSFTAGFDLFEV